MARELLELVRAIGARQVARARDLLTEAPELSRAALEMGASREEASSYFFDAISHYAYAGDTALHLAAAAYEAELAARLLTLGANARARNRRGAEPLHYASDGVPGSSAWDPAAQASVVRLLLKAGANAGALDKSGVAPLHRAVRTRSVGAVRALLEHGVDVNARNASGSAALHLAVQDTGRSASGSTASREAQAQVIELLLAHGARASERSGAGKTALELARSDWVRELLRAQRVADT